MTPQAARVLEAQGLTRRFGATVAVKDLTVHLDRGEIFALLGPDGSGKTTTLRMLSGAIAPTSGTITIEGIDLSRDPERVHERVGYMPQRFSLYGDLTVRENLDFYARLFNVSPQILAARSQQLLEFSGLTTFRDRLAAQLSGGMKQKLALACTLVHDPQILLLDEPTAGVDPVSRREFWRILYELNRREVTILVSTTYMDEAERCATVGLLYAGELIAVEDPGAMRRRMRGDVVEFVAEPKAVARRIIETSPEILSRTVIGDRFHVVVPDAAAALPALTRRLEGAGVRLQDVGRVPPSLEDVFVSVIADRRLGAGRPEGPARG